MRKKAASRPIFLLFTFLLFTVVAFLYFANTTNIVAAGKYNTTVYLFYGEGCPHCAQEKVFLAKLEEKYPELKIKEFEVYHNSQNSKYFSEMCKAYGTKPLGVPTIFIGDDYVIGYGTDSTTGVRIEELISNCISNGCIDPVEKVNALQTTAPSSTTITISNQMSTTTTHPISGLKPEKNNNIFDVPLLGKVNLSEISLPALTIIIGLLDGFNPCAMFILCFLLIFLIGTKSRTKVFVIGGVFLFVSGAVYFLFITAWFNFFMIFKFVPVLKILVSILVVAAGLINIKDYFFFQKGVSLTLPKSWKPKVMDKMKKLATLSSLPAMIMGVITVAFVVNVIELMCTIGFPMIYTQILATYNLPPVTYYLYILLYCVMYMIDDFIVFCVAVATLSCMEMTKKRVQIMKLISGILMILLACWFVLS